MFLPMTRIKILESSATKKYSPRVGSEGFVCHPLQTPTYLQVPNKLCKPKINMTHIIAFKYLVYFYKFGNELRRRCESRWTTLILPANNSSSQTSRPPNADEFLKHLPKIIRNKDLLNYARKGINSTLCFIKPATEAGFYDFHMLKAQRRAAIYNSEFTKAIYSTVASEIFTPVRQCLRVSKKNLSISIKHSVKAMNEGNPSEMDYIRPAAATFYKQALRQNYKGPKLLEKMVMWSLLHTMVEPKIIEERRILVQSQDKQTPYNVHQCVKMLDFMRDLTSRI